MVNPQTVSLSEKHVFYTFIGNYNDIYKFSCPDNIDNCNWTKIDTKLKGLRSYGVAIPITSNWVNKICRKCSKGYYSFPQCLGKRKMKQLVPNQYLVIYFLLQTNVNVTQMAQPLWNAMTMVIALVKRDSLEANVVNLFQMVPPALAIPATLSQMKNYILMKLLRNVLSLEESYLSP